MDYLIVINGPPYGSERSYNALRLALSLAGREGIGVRVFLVGDAVACALAGQHTPDGYYNLESMLQGLAEERVPVGCCGTCLEARGITEDRLAEGATHSSVEELTDWTLWADKVVSF